MGSGMTPPVQIRCHSYARCVSNKTFFNLILVTLHFIYLKVAAVLDPNGDPSLPTTPGGNPSCGEYSHGWTEDSITGMCYQVLDMRLNWGEARGECQYRGGWREGGDMASINSLEEQTFFTSNY